MKRTILLHYHEINLKGNNRGWFENQLIRHVHTLLNNLPHGDIRQIAGRLFIDVRPDAPVEEFERRLQRVFGIANLASAWKVPADIETIRTTFAHLLQKKSFKSFRIHARRGTKEFPLNSQKINEDRADLSNPLPAPTCALKPRNLLALLRSSPVKPSLF